MTELKAGANSHKSAARVVKHESPIRIVLANSKGGSGKTTLATNLAAYYASNQEVVSIIDFDPQGSSIHWLKGRPKSLPDIHGVAAYSQLASATRSWLLRKLPAGTSKVIYDTAAGLKGSDLSEMVREADIILIPITPSPIDIRATTEFIKELLLNPAYRANPVPVAAIANRVRRNTLVYTKLELFLRSLKIPFVTTIRDTQFYIKAAECGLGVFEVPQVSDVEQNEWMPLVKWLEKTCDYVRGRQNQPIVNQSA